MTGIPRVANYEWIPCDIDVSVLNYSHILTGKIIRGLAVLL